MVEVGQDCNFPAKMAIRTNFSAPFDHGKETGDVSALDSWSCCNLEWGEKTSLVHPLLYNMMGIVQLGQWSMSSETRSSLIAIITCPICRISLTSLVMAGVFRRFFVAFICRRLNILKLESTMIDVILLCSESNSWSDCIGDEWILVVLILLLTSSRNDSIFSHFSSFFGILTRLSIHCFSVFSLVSCLDQSSILANPCTHTWSVPLTNKSGLVLIYVD